MVNVRMLERVQNTSNKQQQNILQYFEVADQCGENDV